MPCAICSNTNDSTELCTPCRRAPENADWGAGREWHTGDVDTFPGQFGASHRHMLNDRPPRPPTPLQTRIIHALGTGKRVPRIDARGHRRGTYYRRWRNYEEPAAEIGCSAQYVGRLALRSV